MKYTPETPKANLQQLTKPTEKTPKSKKEQPNNHKGAQTELQKKLNARETTHNPPKQQRNLQNVGLSFPTPGGS
jgi:hypothetical protein